jgi:hypothetical protein
MRFAGRVVWRSNWGAHIFLSCTSGRSEHPVEAIVAVNR